MPSKLIDYLQLMRAPAVFTALSNIVAAQLIVTEGQLQWEILLLLGISSMSLYVSGMILNDCFDYQEDCQDRPERPLPSGRISLKRGWVLGWSFLAGGIISSAAIGYTQLLIALALSGLIVFYNSFAKKNLYGCVIMGACRYVNWLLGLSTVALNSVHFILAAPILIYVSSLTFLSRIETTAKSKKYIVICSFGMLLCALMISYIQRYSLDGTISSLFVLVAGFLILLQRLFKTYQNFSPPAIQQTIKFLIMGVIPLDALVVFSTSHGWHFAVILSLMLPGWFLARSLRVT